VRTWLPQSERPAAQTQRQCAAACVWGARAPRPPAPPQVRVGQKREHVDVFMMKDADHSASVRCFMFLLQSRVFRDRTRGSIYQHVRRAAGARLQANPPRRRAFSPELQAVRCGFSPAVFQCMLSGAVRCTGPCNTAAPVREG
jgi:hypothetical protein